MDKEKIYGIIMGIMVLVAGVLFVKQEYFTTEVMQGIEIEEVFPGKIVYDTNYDIDVSKYRNHCDGQGGLFSECGDICAIDAEVCVEVCAYTCTSKFGEVENPEPTPEPKPGPEKKITNFEECIEAGNPAMESYPRQCRAGSKSFTENIGNLLAMEDQIILDYPRPNQVVLEKLKLYGQARGTWFFEADAPVVVTDWDGKIIGEGYISTTEDWMTENFISFTGEIEFEIPEMYDYGTLILQKANPSDLPENDAALEVPIRF